MHGSVHREAEILKKVCDTYKQLLLILLIFKYKFTSNEEKLIRIDDILALPVSSGQAPMQLWCGEKFLGRFVPKLFIRFQQ